MRPRGLNPVGRCAPLTAGRTLLGGTAIVSAGRDRLETLDLLRGLAALAILARHFPWPGGDELLLPKSYLGVDLFFTLSGFVIAYSYQHRLEAGMAAGRFVLARLVRLYPLYFLATLLGAAQIAVRLLRGGEYEGFGPLAIALATGALFLPTPSDWSGWPRALFPLNYVAWSLFFELAVNILYGLLALRLTNRLLGALILLGAILLGLAVARAGTLDVGADWSNAHWASGRALFSFFAGVAVYRWRTRFRPPAVPAWLLGMLLLAALAPPESWPWGYDLACIAVLFPLLVRAAADASSGPAMRTVSRQLGFASYPVYVLQMALIAVLTVLLDRGFGMRLADLAAFGLLLHFAFVVGVSWLVARWLDEPVRAWLKRRFGLPAARAPAQTAP